MVGVGWGRGSNDSDTGGERGSGWQGLLRGAPSQAGAGAGVGGRDGEVLISVYIRVYIQEKNAWAGGGGLEKRLVCHFQG